MLSDLEKLITLDGNVEKIIFHNPLNGFTIARLKTPMNAELVTIVGTLPPISPGEELKVKGLFQNNKSHGRQFAVKEVQVTTPQDVRALEKFLGSGVISGIGPEYAKRIIEQFGEKTLSIIDENPEALLNVSGIGKKKLLKIEASWEEHKAIRSLLIFLARYSISPSFAFKIFKKYGSLAISKIEENPYRLAQDIPGIGFKSADLIALKMGFEKTSAFRIDSGIEFLLLEEAKLGHTCAPKDTFSLHAEKILEVDKNLIEEGFSRLKASSRILEEMIDKKVFLWIKGIYLSEMGIAKEIFRLLEAPPIMRSIDIDKAVPWVEEKLSLKLAEKQKEAVSLAFKEKLLILTGGPGTGKSTITKAILAIAEKITRRIALAAPTGKAAKRLTEITRREAYTLHSLLQYDPREGGFRRGHKNPIPADLFIVDESSMIDTSLMYHLLKAIPDHAKLILVGDVDQLPSIGPGNVLKDLLESNAIAKVRLNEIFRQAAHSKIITNAHRINEGKFPDIKVSSDDFMFYQIESPEEALKQLIELASRILPRSFGFRPLEDIQVLTPMKRGLLGTENLNLALQEALNPNGEKLSIGSIPFAVGDKVIQTRNNYEKEVFNGDIGKVIDLNREKNSLTIAFDEKKIEYETMELDELMLAYAISIHKYQGSEAPCILCPIHTSHFIMLARNLLYTAITRGKKQVVLVGTPKAIALAVGNDQARKRFTGLKQRLNDFLIIKK